MKRLSLILEILVVLVIVDIPVAAAFTDVPVSHESRRAIEYLQSQGIVEGYSDGRFGPAFPINRAEFLKILITANGMAAPPGAVGGCFPDVADQWYAPYVCLASQLGWVQGYPDGTFKPERTVSFVEALKMLANARGYPQAPPEESTRRGVDASAWFAPFLTTSLLLDVVSYDQIWGTKAIPLQQPLTRGLVAQFLYRALLAEGSVRLPLAVSNCTIAPTALVINTYVDVLMPVRTNIFRQELRGVNDAGVSCLLSSDGNPFARVGAPFDPYFLQPYPGGQPKDSWSARIPLKNGRAVLRGATFEGAFRPEVFIADVIGGELRQLPSIFAAPGGSIESLDHRYIVYVGSTGRTLEAVDLELGAHVVIDAAQEPLTFESSNKAAKTSGLALDSAHVVSYTLYDGSVVDANGGYLRLEVRTADLETIFMPFGFDLLNP